MIRSVDVRELDMSFAVPFRRGDEVGELGQFLDVEVLVRRARMEPVIERLSAAFAAKDVEETEGE